MRPASIDKHLGNLERFFGNDEWQFGTGHDFDAQRAVRALRRYIARLERSLDLCRRGVDPASGPLTGLGREDAIHDE